MQIMFPFYYVFDNYIDLFKSNNYVKIFLQKGLGYEKIKEHYWNITCNINIFL